MNLGVEIYGLIFTVMFNSGPIVQLYKIYKNKSSENVSIVMFVMCIIGHCSIFMYLVSYNVSGMFNYINSGINMVLCFALIYSIIKFR